MIFDHSDAVGFLKECLEEKTKANPRFSLRAFAQRLLITPGGLSLILSRKKRLSPEKAAEMVRGLGLTGSEAEYFILLNQLPFAKSEEYRTQILEKLNTIKGKGRQRQTDPALISIDRFRLISKWYGFACFELLTLKPQTGEKWTPRLVAERLGISYVEASSTIERLKRLNLVKEVSPGVFRQAGDIVIKSEKIEEALVDYYTSLHALSETSVRSQTHDQKYIGSQVFAFDPSDLHKVKAITDRYLDRLNDLSKEGKNPREVYVALANIFRVTVGPKGISHEKPKPTKKSNHRQKEEVNP